MMLLNAVLKPTSRHNIIVDGKKFMQKTTIREAIHSSFVHINCINDMQMIREERTRKSLERKVTIQPYIIVVGPNLLSLNEILLCADEILYKFNSFVSALDTCFKIFHVFNLNYPTESILIWYFLQKQVYEISTPFDVQSPALLEFLNAFKDG